MRYILRAVRRRDNIAALKNYIEKGCALILTSHCTPEDLKDKQTKIEYLKALKALAASSKSTTAPTELYRNFRSGRVVCNAVELHKIIRIQ